ncbi:MAG: HYR domain-containing protein, partial [Thermoanaerobaculia bacterium]
MKRAAFGLLCFFVLVPTAFAQISSFGPTSFYSFEFEQNATIHGVDLFGDFYGDPDSSNIFLSTQLLIDGPAGTFTRDISGGSRTPATLNDTIFVAIPDETLLVEGHYSVTVIAHDDTGDRSIGPVFYDVVARPVEQNPLLSIPENVFAAATSASGANVTFFVGGTSFVDPAPVISCDHNSGDLYPIGETIVHCTATDSFGSASGSFPVFVFDSGAPTVTVPADIVTGNPVVTFTVTATDVIDGPVTATCSPASGSTFDLGTTTVNCIAYDSQGNAGFGSFNVTVSNGPVLTLPAPITAEATSSAGAAVSYTVTATDNATIVCTPASGSTFALGTTTVNCTATASTGTTSGSFTVTVRDTTPPALSLPANITAEATGPGGRAVSYTATANDLVDGSRPVTCDHASGSTFPLGTTTVQCTATDTHNNT